MELIRQKREEAGGWERLVMAVNNLVSSKMACNIRLHDLANMMKKKKVGHNVKEALKSIYEELIKEFCRQNCCLHLNINNERFTQTIENMRAEATVIPLI